MKAHGTPTYQVDRVTMASRRGERPLGWLACGLALLTTLSCHGVDRFDTRSGEVYCGKLVGQRVISLGFEEPGWSGSANENTMELANLRTGELFKGNGIAAEVSSNDAVFGPCAAEQKPLFDRSKLRTIGSTLGDRLSAMQLGEDHDEDFVTFLDSTCSGSMVAILSLIQDGKVELRLLRPAKAATLDAEQPTASSPDQVERFGLFQLTKTKEGCGF